MSHQEPVYEMLWDCRHCGAKKLLGLTHRYCPECGAPQDELPAGAKGAKRYRAVRSHEQVQVGEDCQTRKVDNGDGTFREKRECKPRYEKKPVEDDKCDFSVDKWSTARTATARGGALAPEPNWPEVKLARTGCSAIGCERVGAQREMYTVTFKNLENGDTGECNFNQTKWQSYQPGANLKAKVGVVGGWLDCATLSGR